MLLLTALLAVAAADPADVIQYRAAEALIVDKEGKPLFRAPRDFLLLVSGNPEGRVVAYDPAARRVRVSEHQPWWVSCSQLRPQAVACAEPARPKTRSIILPVQGSASGDAMTGPNGRGVPSCPGDPRCPKAD